MGGLMREEQNMRHDTDGRSEERNTADPSVEWPRSREKEQGTRSIGEGKIEAVRLASGIYR
jgi:hypothetical protein